MDLHIVLMDHLQKTKKEYNNLKKQEIQNELDKACIKRKRITTKSKNPYFILATFLTCFFSRVSTFNDEKIKLQGLQ